MTLRQTPLNMRKVLQPECVAYSDYPFLLQSAKENANEQDWIKMSCVMTRVFNFIALARQHVALLIFRLFYSEGTQEAIGMIEHFKSGHTWHSAWVQ